MLARQQHSGWAIGFFNSTNDTIPASLLSGGLPTSGKGGLRLGTDNGNCGFRLCLRVWRGRTGERIMEYTLKLYIAGLTTRSENALSNLRRLCDKKLAGVYELIVIDVLECPQAAEEANILATPTLVKATPLPQRRMIGDLSDEEAVLHELTFLTVDRGRGEERSKKNGGRRVRCQ